MRSWTKALMKKFIIEYTQNLNNQIKKIKLLLMSLITAKSTAKSCAYDCREITLLCMEAIYTAFEHHIIKACNFFLNNYSQNRNLIFNILLFFRYGAFKGVLLRNCMGFNVWKKGDDINLIMFEYTLIH